MRPFFVILLYSTCFSSNPALANQENPPDVGLCTAQALQVAPNGPREGIVLACANCLRGRNGQRDDGSCGGIALSWCFSNPNKCKVETGCRSITSIDLDCRAKENAGLISPPARIPSFSSPSSACPGHMREDPAGSRQCKCVINDKPVGDSVPFGSQFMDETQCKKAFGGASPSPTAAAKPAQPSNQNPNPSAGSSASCSSAQQAAQACCYRPETCSSQPTISRSGGESIPAYCERMRNVLNSGVANQAADACMRKITDCRQACGVDAGSCDSLQSQVQALGSQGLSHSMSGEYARLCTDNSSSAPQSAGGGSPGGGEGPGGLGNPDPSGEKAAEEARRAAEEALAKRAVGQVDFQKPEAENSDFNVADQSGVRNPQFSAGDGSGLDKITGGAGAARNATVANNSGGQIPGGQGAPGGAKIAGKGGYGGSPGYTTDIMRGFQSGGGTTPGGGPPAKEDDEGLFSGYGNPRGPAGNEKGLDLKAYLPGARKDPGIRYGGQLKPMSAEINGPNVNIWVKVTERFWYRCRLGKMYDCR